MPILVWMAALRVAGPRSVNSLASAYAVFALLALALALIVLCFFKARTTRTSKPEVGRESRRWEAFLRPR